MCMIMNLMDQGRPAGRERRNSSATLSPPTCSTVLFFSNWSYFHYSYHHDPELPHANLLASPPALPAHRAVFPRHRPQIEVALSRGRHQTPSSWSQFQQNTSGSRRDISTEPQPVAVPCNLNGSTHGPEIKCSPKLGCSQSYQKI